MGRRLGPTFAEFYMCNLEKEFFESKPDLTPIFCACYVEEILLGSTTLNKFTKLNQSFKKTLS